MKLDLKLTDKQKELLATFLRNYVFYYSKRKGLQGKRLKNANTNLPDKHNP